MAPSTRWKDDPWAHLPPIAEHPGDSPPLSPTPDSPSLEASFVDIITHKLNDYEPVSDDDSTAKVLQAFVDELSGEGRSILLGEIYHFAADPPKLRQLRHFLVDAILKPMKSAGGKQPPITPSPHDSAAPEIQLAMTSIETSSRSAQPRLKEQCLRRDGNRCVACGQPDLKAFDNMHPNERQGLVPVRTECAHILPFALSKFEESNATQAENKTMIWWALHRYFPALKGKIYCDSVNQPANAITIAAVYHADFGEFQLGFRATNEVEHQYHVEILRNMFFHSHLPKVVTFKQYDPTVPRPDPDILGAHLQIARILAVSGIGDLIERACYDDRGRFSETIAPDGSTDLEGIIVRKMLSHI